jgi:nucleotide-binding universal stress UspA family protein
MSVKTIVLAVDGEDPDLTDRLAATTADIAGPADAEVVVTHVLDESEYRDARDRLNFADGTEVTPTTIARRNVGVRKLADELERAGLESTTYGRLSDGTSKGERLAEVAEDVGADMVVVGGRRRSPTGKALFGSTSQDVLLESACPVTFVRAA